MGFFPSVHYIALAYTDAHLLLFNPLIQPLSIFFQFNLKSLTGYHPEGSGVAWKPEIFTRPTFFHILRCLHQSLGRSHNVYNSFLSDSVCITTFSMCMFVCESHIYPCFLSLWPLLIHDITIPQSQSDLALCQKILFSHSLFIHVCFYHLKFSN